MVGIALPLLGGCIETRTDFMAPNEVVITAQSRTLLNDNVSAEVLKQAALVTRNNGFRYFEIMGAGDASRRASVLIPGEATTNGAVTGNGNFATYNGSTVYTPPMVMGIVLPGEQIRVHMFKDGDSDASNPRVFDANQVLRR